MYSGKRGDMETIQGKTSPNAQGTIGCAPSVRVPIVFVGILGDGKKNINTNQKKGLDSRISHTLLGVHPTIPWKRENS